MPNVSGETVIRGEKWYMAAVTNIFDTGDQFHGRQFFHGLRGRDGSGSNASDGGDGSGGNASDGE